MDKNDSDSDDFFDARQDINSPRTPPPGSLVLPVFEDNPLPPNPNSPSHLGGDLSLDHLLSESSPIVEINEQALTVTIQPVHEKETSYPVNLSTDIKCPEVSEEKPPDDSVKNQDVDNLSCSSSKPDLVACIQERPSNLPGVRPVVINKVENNAKLLRPVAASSTSQHHSLPRPSRPPPPRPKDPPKRPPPPKSAPPTKLTFSSGDDHLLTPNTAVDNITKEFAEALSQDQLHREPKAQPRKQYSFTKKESSSVSVTAKQETQQGTPQTASKANQAPANASNNKMDEEILSTVIVRNLDTGQTMPLSVAAEQVSQCLNPLALQIMSRTKEFSYAGAGSEDRIPTPPSTVKDQQFSLDSLQQSSMTSEDTISVASDEITIGGEAPFGAKSHESGARLRVRSKRFKKIISKRASKVKAAAETKVEKAVQRVKQAKQDGSRNDSLNVSSDEEASDSFVSSSVKTKASSSNKGPYHFGHLKLVQDIAVHVGAVWSMKFSHCGRLLATAGQNNIIWVWVLKDWYHFFNDMRKKYDSKERGAVFATPPRGSMDPPPAASDNLSEPDDVDQQMEEDEDAPFKSLPFSSYYGHTADVLDLAWSKNYFTLSSSMDKTVRLWHVSQKECLCCFQHIDFVTAISFHPRDDRYFLSGSLDGKLRLWNIPEKKVALWNEVNPDSSSNAGATRGGALITTVNFCENGKFAVCGTYDGRCLFYDTEHLKYHTQIHVRSSRGRNQKGHKITGIEPLANEHKILVTSNDSRVRLYDLRDLSLTCKYRGLANLSSQIKASFSPDNQFIICGSEDKSIYIWRTSLPQDVTKLSSFRRDRNDCWESIRAHNAVVTCAIFAPKPQRKERNELSARGRKASTASGDSYVIISADFNGVIKIFTPT